MTTEEIARLEKVKEANDVLNHNNPAWKAEIDWLIEVAGRCSNHNRDVQETFYGGKDGVDFVCFDKEMKIVASGNQEDMIKLHEKYGYPVGKLEAIKFSS